MIITDATTAYITVTDGRTILVDLADLDLVRNQSWHIHSGTQGKSCGAVTDVIRDGRKTLCIMHRLILNAPPRVEIVHLNRNKLDNRRCNLALGNTPGVKKNTRIRPINIENGIGLVPLTKGFIAKIDVGDIESVSRYNWSLSAKRYAVSWQNRDRIYLHRFLLNVADDVEIDHVNGDPLDNRRENLRVATRSQNQSNTQKAKNNQSGFKGVSWYSRATAWRTTITKNGKQTTLGLFDDPVVAACVYDKAALELFGEFACTNKMEPICGLVGSWL